MRVKGLIRGNVCTLLVFFLSFNGYGSVLDLEAESGMEASCFNSSSLTKVEIFQREGSTLVFAYILPHFHRTKCLLKIQGLVLGCI